MYKNNEVEKFCEFDENEIKMIEGFELEGVNFFIYPLNSTNESNNEKYGFSIWEADLMRYVKYFLVKYFNKNLKENTQRQLSSEDKDLFVELCGDNYFSFDEVCKVILEIQTLVKLLKLGFTKKEFIEQFPILKRDKYNKIDLYDNISNSYHTIDAIINFYIEFSDRLQKIIDNSKDCDLVNFEAP